MQLLLLILIPAFIYIILKKRKPKVFFPVINDNHRKFLLDMVEFYRELSAGKKVQFEDRVRKFLCTTRILGINTPISEKDKLLVGCSAIIPIFSYPHWEYHNLYEVLIYPTTFDENYNTGGSDKRISGMVGTGVMEGKMILSKTALLEGFNNSNDKKNVGIHEFIHLIDKADGKIDGIPSLLMDKQYAIPWLDHMKKEIESIRNNNSDINPYGGFSKEEFFPVISEYFFERPKLLRLKHPELYEFINEIFTTDLAKKYKGIKRPSQTGRNDTCPCGSGKKYKQCCLNSK